MSERHYDDIFDTLADLEIPEGEEFSLESILAEFGQGAAEPALKEAEMPKELPKEETPVLSVEEADEPETAEEDLVPEEPDETFPELAAEEEAPAEDRRRRVLRFPFVLRKKAAEVQEADEPETAAEDTALREELPERVPEEPAAEEEPPQVFFAEETEEDETAQMQHISLEEMMAHTVDAVLEEQDEEEPEVRVSLQQRFAAVAAAAAAAREKLPFRRTEAAKRTVEEEPEPEMDQADREERRRGKRLRTQLLLTGIPTLLLVTIAVLDTWWPEVLMPLWGSLDMLRTGSVMALLGLTVLLAGEVWKTALQELKRRRVTCEAAAAVSAAAVFGDCIYSVIIHSSEHLPLAAPAALLIWLCLVGRLCASSALRSACHLADLGGQPPYAVTVTAAGACKQQGRLDGFYRTACKSDPARNAQHILLPLLLSTATVLTGVVCIGERRMDEFFHIWSVMLALSVPLSLPLTGTLPMRHLNRRLSRSAGAVAGYAGARAISESRRMVVTDGDLFPPGTVSLNGLKLYGEEIGKVVSYAATMTRAARSQLHPIFEQLLSSEGGSYRRAEDLQFYEEGGFSATIHGETVAMGSAYFMKKHKVELPRELKVKTGVFMAVDGHLIAIFAMKYQASHNVEWALRAMRRSRIEPVLAVRSGNVTPGLIKRRFNLDPRAVYPEVSARLALSDLTRETAPQANAIIYREGLMPFAETVIGSRRCCRAVRRGTVLCWLGALVGLWLGYYLSHAAAYGALSAGYLLIFLLLWLLPAVLLADMAHRY